MIHAVMLLLTADVDVDEDTGETDDPEEIPEDDAEEAAEEANVFLFPIGIIYPHIEDAEYVIDNVIVYGPDEEE